ncbi:site-specific DNA-methyltransferase [Paenibacillus sp. LMG 31461]|uniref:Methyltransferase n=1 Tax=Paenibacillus plantarum TaxID=2654975 RepID=A0ABX1XIL6_9BACL|nr:site-specific DNA-methyltransferase [Paenibacillus plantarum]NOU68365.1 site-specific DNA-methyltransferase [Paenibacillus plantarum]
MLLYGDCVKVMREQLQSESFQTCVTSPPYWGLRDYGVPASEWPEVTYIPMAGVPPISISTWSGCLGLEPTPEMFVGHMILVFREVWRVLRDDGTLWLNFGDSYAGAGPRKDEGFNERYHGKQYLSNKQGDIDRVRPGRQMPSGLKAKDLIGIPWRVAFALQADGWYLRMDNIWAKPNPMPESVQDRTTKAHEYIFLLSKSERYYYDKEAIKEPGVQDEWANGFRGGAYTGNNTFNNAEGGKRIARGNYKIPSGWDIEQGSHGTIHRTGRSKANSFKRFVNESPPPGQPPQHREDREEVEYSGMRNKRSVWTVATQPFPEAHFATFPEKLIEPCILAGAPIGGHVLDPFGGSGTTARVAIANNRNYTLIDINPEYIKMQHRRTANVQTNLF